MDLYEKTISSQDVFNGRIIKLRVDTVTLPNGKQSTREIIDHTGAVAIVALDENNRLVMVKQFRKALESVTLEIPAGTREKDENPLLCARRELEEETGLQAKKWKEILHYYSAPGFCNEKLHLFVATGLENGLKHTDEDEFVETVRIPLKEAYKMIFNGEITDAKSIIGIQYMINGVERE